MYYKINNDAEETYIETSLTDQALLCHSFLNKGMAFNEEERVTFGLLGLLPPHQANLADQRTRSYKALQSKATDLEKYIYLRELQDSNETLFYSLLCEHTVELMPLVYTPIVGQGCQYFSHIYRRPRGLYLAYPYRDRIEQILANPRFNQVEVVVVSDGERILGLGDQGAGGMGIPIGKLTLYTVCAGIHPATTLPILLDTGTNNPALLQDPLYIGWRHERIRGADYAEFIDTFVQALKKRFPHILLQWEDFAQQNAHPILERYRDQLCTFNDDIQGTAAVAAGALLAAIQVTGVPLREQRIVVVGAGSAGTGISNLILQAMLADGLPLAEARSRFYLLNSRGLLVEGMSDLLPFQETFIQTNAAIAPWKVSNPLAITLQEVVENAHPTLLIGVSGQAGIFTQSIVQTMAKHVERPIIFPLSNPTSHSEANPQDLITWTDGRAITSTGSPFPNVEFNGHSKRIDQTNNAYIFPGMGLGIIAVKASRVSDKMFMAAALALADCSPAKTDRTANLLPPLSEIRDVSFKVACAVAEQAIAEGLAEPLSKDEIAIRIRRKIWKANYVPYRKNTNLV